MTTPDAVTLLVATDNVTDAALVKNLLEKELAKVAKLVVSTNPDAAAMDFERLRPDVLVLAFDNLEKAERYYLGLYRLCPMVQQHIHRTVILCNKDEVKRVYELCMKNYFDDYVLFWPMTYDMSRLAMAVHHALRELAAVKDGDSGPSLLEFAAQAISARLARRIGSRPARWGRWPTASGQRYWWPTTTNSSASSWPASSRRRTIACSSPAAVSRC